MQAGRERFGDDAIPAILTPLLGLEDQPHFVDQAPLALPFRLHQPEVDQIHTNRRVDPFRVRLEVAADFRLKYVTHT